MALVSGLKARSNLPWSQIQRRVLRTSAVRLDTSPYRWHRIKPDHDRPKAPVTSFAWSPTFAAGPNVRPIQDHGQKPKRHSAKRLVRYRSGSGSLKIDEKVSPIKLDEHLHDLHLCSRTEAFALMQEGRLKVNGKIVTTNKWLKPDDDEITIDNFALEDAVMRTFIVHKPATWTFLPRGDPLNRTSVLAFMPPIVNTLRGLWMATPVLRDAHGGVCLLTTDMRVAQMANQMPATYRIAVERRLAEDEAEAVAGQFEGMAEIRYIEEDGALEVDVVAGGWSSATARLLSTAVESFGKGKVVLMTRVKLGDFSADELMPSQHRELTDVEVASMLDLD